MRWWLMAGVVAFGLATPPCGTAAEPAPRGPKKPEWFGSYEQAKAAARQSGKPMFVVFRCVP
jgi:hypothetical protein